GGDYELLHNGIEVERFSKATPWPTTAPTVFFVGRHEPRKGLAVLLDALRLLPSDVRLWVGGDGPETECLREAHGDDPRVEWLGRLDDEQVARRLRGADAFCAPSLHGESFGVVLLEAMASTRNGACAFNPAAHVNTPSKSSTWATSSTCWVPVAATRLGPW